MAFVVSEGQIQSLFRPTPSPNYSLRIADDYTRDYAQIWRTQQSVRTCVTFLARNIASLGLHAFERVSDTDRVRLADHPAALLLDRPSPTTTRYRLIDRLVHDLGIYDTAYWLKIKTSGGGLALLRISPKSVTPMGETGLEPSFFRIRGTKGYRDVKPDELVRFRGYDPDGDNGAPPIEALRQILAEEWEAGRMRTNTLRNGARVSGYIERPAGNGWSAGAREKFRKGWQAQYTGGGPQVGGTPILEDGMKFVSAAQTAEQLQYVETRKLTREEAASAYFIPPPMVGILDHATFGNIEEQHKMLYQDTLGPWLSMIEQELKLQLLPDLPDTKRVYVEFNLAEKLRGSFEEQAQAASTATGAPWMTRNEQRARFNLPALEGGDELVTPLNVLVGGQASPRDGQTAGGGAAALPNGDEVKKLVEAAAALIRSGFDPAGALAAVGLDPIAHLGLLPVTVQRPQEPENVDQEAVDALKSKGRPPATYTEQAENVLAGFFKRQRAAVLSALGAKAPDWWDADRWDSELADDLVKIAHLVADKIGPDTAEALGFNADDYDVDRTAAFLREVAKSRAGAINATTLDQLEAAVADEDGDPAVVFDQAEAGRKSIAATTLVTTFAAFATAEAAHQLAPQQATKTWNVSSSNPRASHARMNGETVGIDELFSNGMNWPGDPAGGVDEVAGCTCGVTVSVQ